MARLLRSKRIPQVRGAYLCDDLFLTILRSHAAHYVIALWSLGADASIIEAAYKQDCEYQRPAFESPGPITVDNFKDHLGDDEYVFLYHLMSLTGLTRYSVTTSLT